MENGVKILKKISNTCHLKKKRILAHCFDSSKTIISHLFGFKSNVLDNILITAKSLPENRLRARTTYLRHFWIFLLQNYMEASLINILNNQKKSLISLSFSQEKLLNFSVFFLLFRWICPLKKSGPGLFFFVLHDNSDFLNFLRVVCKILVKSLWITHVCKNKKTKFLTCSETKKKLW